MAKKSETLLNPRELKFVAHYCVHFNGSAAVRFAGFESVRPNEYAYELLTKPHIQAQINQVIESLGDLHFRLADENTGRLKAMRDADRTAIFADDGSLIDPKDWPEECKLLLAGIETEERVAGDGESAHLIRVKKVKLEPPKGIIDSLAKITGQFIERTQQLGKDGKPIDPPAVQPVINVTVGAPEAKK
jgi:hypothetical protein